MNLDKHMRFLALTPSWHTYRAMHFFCEKKHMLHKTKKVLSVNSIGNEKFYHV